MTNYEHYKEQIEKIARMGCKVAMKVATNEIVTCDTITCDECLFNSDNCSIDAMKWADEEYKQVDWSKVPVDTPILVSEDSFTWTKRHFACFQNNKVYAFRDGATSWSASNAIMDWNFAKLVEADDGI